MSETEQSAPLFLRWTGVRVVGVSLARWLAYALGIAAMVWGVVTVLTMSNRTSDLQTIGDYLKADIALLVLLGIVVGWRLLALWLERRRGLAGSRLHVRLVVLFGLVATVPTVLVAIFSATFLEIGLQAWFSERVKRAIEDSHTVAKAYFQEHRENIRADALAMANDLNREAFNLMLNPRVLSQVLSAQASLRSLSEAILVDSTGRTLARSEFSQALEFDLIPPAAMEVARAGQIAVLTSEQDDRVRAAVRLHRFPDAYLIVGRLIDSRVLDHMQRVERGVAQYRTIERERVGIQFSFIMMFAVVALLVLLAAVWVGLMLATQLTAPIASLVAAAERIGKGDLSVRVENRVEPRDLQTLSRAFNHMASEIENKQRGLIEANRELDERRRFTETVLAGVSAGVIGLDSNGCINLPNRSASDLLGIDIDSAIGKLLADVIPEMAGLLAEAMRRPERVRQAEIKIVTKGTFHTFLVRIAGERSGTEAAGFVVTFDDVTELLSAQRKAAWADVARRIAHEIKNPLTPIQLSAERLKRKYLKEITSEPETFAQCTETIVRQVEDIGRMVDEFSSFARMPQPSLKPENLSRICRETVFLECNRFPEISFDVRLPQEDIGLRCDGRQVARAIANLLKNAAESIVLRRAGPSDGDPGWVRLSVEQNGEAAGVTRIVVEDNGQGLPSEERDRLTEPYVTTRTKGTGLGLAIVKKIMEDHGGDLVLEDRLEGGARVSLIFRESEEPISEPREGNSQTRAVLDATVSQGS
ncbi:MAG: PAS domain-containing sensor histidine kinase [Rhodospirillales bacterium]|nr:PAS domain-containing sensor histidine kinase [Rhodospirillales bacterium]